MVASCGRYNGVSIGSLPSPVKPASPEPTIDRMIGIGGLVAVTVGVTVGVAVGAAVGVSVGVSVALSVGTGVRVAVGVAESAAVGVTVAGAHSVSASCTQKTNSSTVTLPSLLASKLGHALSG